MNFLKEITLIQEAVLSAIERAQSQENLESIRLEFLSRKGKLAQLTDQFASLPLEEKKVIGPVLSTCKKLCQEAFEKKKEAIERELKKTAHNDGFDPSLDYIPMLHARIHPLTRIQEEVVSIFNSMGYELVDGPEIETEFYNFEALNIAADHPARDMWDTLWVDIPGMLLRTHTSSVQVRTMLTRTPPFAIVAAGRCYRHEATDASHDIQFMQMEGMLIAEKVSLSNLLATVEKFLHIFFGKKLLTRIRPSYFPFVEPGIEIDIECPFCTQGCSTCKESRWIETCGAGLVHPRVLSACSIDPEKYSGFAFGFGLTRLAMIKYRISDIRLLHAHHDAFLRQF
jgi:phenylalanyl-tRNA synthetase alpha chain